MSIEEIKSRLDAATPGPWKANNDGTIDGPEYAEVIYRGPVDCMSYCYGGTSVIEGDNLKPDAEFIAHAPEDVRRLLNAVEAVVDLHKPRTEQIITGDCADESCGHEESDDCPKSPFEVCVECWRVAEEADAYFSEGSIPIASYPCPTVKAITTALEAKP